MTDAMGHFSRTLTAGRPNTLRIKAEKPKVGSSSTFFQSTAVTTGMTRKGCDQHGASQGLAPKGPVEEHGKEQSEDQRDENDAAGEHNRIQENLVKIGALQGAHVVSQSDEGVAVRAQQIPAAETVVDGQDKRDLRNQDQERKAGRRKPAARLHGFGL